jgi:hypothetical protein
MDDYISLLKRPEKRKARPVVEVKKTPERSPPRKIGEKRKDKDRFKTGEESSSESEKLKVFDETPEDASPKINLLKIEEVPVE